MILPKKVKRGAIIATLTMTLVGGFGLAMGGVAYAQEDNQSSPSASPSQNATESASPTQQETEITAISTEEIKGEVLRVGDQTISIQTDDQTLELTLVEGVQITRNGDSTRVSDIQPGDEVVAEVNKDNNQVLSLEATTPSIMDEMWFWPAVVGGLLLIILLIWMAKRSQKEHIKTTQTHLG